MKAEYTMESSLGQYGYESCITIMDAKLLSFDTDEELASCKVYFIDFTNAQKETGCHNLLDVHGETYEFVGLFNDDYILSSEVANHIDPYFNPDRVIVIHALRVNKEHQGRKLSKVLVDDIERHFAGVFDVLALKAYPLENNTPETTKSLSKYYESIGFARTGVNDILIKTFY